MPIRAAAIVLLLVAAACSSSDTEPPPRPGPTTSAPTATTEPPAPTTTEPAATPTTADGPRTVTIEGDLPRDLAELVTVVYERLADDRNGADGLPAGLVAHLDAIDADYAPLRRAEMVSAELVSGEQVAVVTVGEDRVFAAWDGDRWHVVGMAPAGSPPWLMEEPGLLLVIGSDARPGQLQTGYRADSIHVLALSPSADAGTIVGFPRDTYITMEVITEANEVVGLPEDELPARALKWTSLMAGRGPEIMLETARVLTGLPIDGYIVTGFLGFDALITELGGLRIDLPSDMASGNNWADFPAGEQFLDPTRALQLARIRKGLRGGDFARSLNQGLIMLAAMEMVQDRGIDALPDLVKILTDHTFTDLDAGALLAFAAAGLLMDPGGLGNLVLPGDVETINTRSVVLLDEAEMERVLRDVADDGVVSP